MASPTLLAGNLARLYRSAGGSPETFTFVCIATTRMLTMNNEFEDATVPDCTTPTSIPARKNVLRSTSWSMRFSGLIDAAKFPNFRADFASITPVRYQLLIDKLLAAGGGSWTGALFFESLEVGTTNNGLTTFNVTARGDDVITWADAAA